MKSKRESRNAATGIDEFFGDDLDSSFDAVLEFITQPGRFERGLNRLLDGIEAEVLAKPSK